MGNDELQENGRKPVKERVDMAGPITSNSVATGRRVLKNYFALTAARVAGAILSFLATAYLARVLTAEGFGVIGFCQAAITYLLLLVDMGFGYYCVRETAGDDSKITRYTNNVLSMRSLLAAAGYIILVLFALLSSKPKTVQVVLLIMGLKVLLSAFDLKWVFQARERMGWIALSKIAPQVLYVLAVFLLIHNPSHLLRVPVMQAAAMAGTTLIMLALYLRREGAPRFGADTGFWKTAFRQSMPMAAIYLLNQVYINFDMIMLGFTHGETTVGHYNAAYKVILMLNLFGSYYFFSLYPNISRIFSESREKLRSLLEFSIRQVGIIVIPLAVGGTVLAGPIILFVFGDGYSAGILPFGILIWSIAIINVRQHFSSALIASGNQKNYMYGAILGAVSNVLLNLIFIPRYGMRAAALTTIFSEVLVFIYVYRKLSLVTNVSFLRSLPRPLIASAVMAAVLLMLPNWNVFIRIVIGAAVYLPVLYLIGGIRKGDIDKLEAVFKGKAGG